jgi:ATP-dependent DNA helicase RecQ
LASLGEQAAAVVERVRELGRSIQGFEPRHVAVLARTHAALQPIRAALEAVGIPVSWTAARGALPSLHRIGETAVFLDYLAEHPSADLTYRDLLRLESHLGGDDGGDDGGDEGGNQRDAAPSPWRKVLREALSAWRAEAGEDAVGSAAIASFLYDTLAEQRRAPSFGDGVVLSTVHAAKGLEFRHVVIADGGWALSDVNRLDEEQRLFYVAMTRARDTLQVLAVDGSGHPHATALRHVLEERRQGPLPFAPEVLAKRYEVLGLDSLFLSWPAAEHTFDDESLRRRSLAGTARLSTGTRVQLEARGTAVRAVSEGIAVAQLSAQAADGWRDRLDQIVEARVLALVRRRRDDGEPEHRDGLVLDRWDVPLLEVVTVPR